MYNKQGGCGVDSPRLGLGPALVNAMNLPVLAARSQSHKN